ncbi:MAG TPA: sigma-70 family RNA polymerase sigma factor [Acidimicrobiia bacterium]|nr:sigma-70 family RNA polymerase sigma factor [Acidimicrobiia bacterium]
MKSPIPVWGKRSDRSVLSVGDDAGGEGRFDGWSGEGAPLRPSDPETLFRQSYRSIVQTLALAGGDLAAAEDATQEAFAEACVRWNRISRYDNPGAWVRRVAINKLRSAHRSRVRGAAAMERMASEIATAPQLSEAETDLIAELRRLPDKQRLAAVLFYVEGLSTLEVAEAMGISQGSVSQHLNRARSALRSHLEATP